VIKSQEDSLEPAPFVSLQNIHGRQLLASLPARWPLRLSPAMMSKGELGCTTWLLLRDADDRHAELACSPAGITRRCSPVGVDTFYVELSAVADSPLRSFSCRLPHHEGLLGRIQEPVRGRMTSSVGFSPLRGCEQGDRLSVWKEGEPLTMSRSTGTNMCARHRSKPRSSQLPQGNMCLDRSSLLSR
jgi:hypothetical protein